LGQAGDVDSIFLAGLFPIFYSYFKNLGVVSCAAQNFQATILFQNKSSPVTLLIRESTLDAVMANSNGFFYCHKIFHVLNQIVLGKLGSFADTCCTTFPKLACRVDSPKIVIFNNESRRLQRLNESG